MWITFRILLRVLLRRHPPADALQAGVDLALRGWANRLTRDHLRSCERCAEEMREAAAFLGSLRFSEPPASEIALARESIVEAMANTPRTQPVVAQEVCRLLGRRAANQMALGSVTLELRREITAFLGARAATQLLNRVSA